MFIAFNGTRHIGFIQRMYGFLIQNKLQYTKPFVLDIFLICLGPGKDDDPVGFSRLFILLIIKIRVCSQNTPPVILGGIIVLF